MKRIVICCDGTWNSPDETDHGIPVPTRATARPTSKTISGATRTCGRGEQQFSH